MPWKTCWKLKKYYSGNPKVHYYLGMSYHGKGMKDKAIENLKKQSLWIKIIPKLIII